MLISRGTSRYTPIAAKIANNICINAAMLQVYVVLAAVVNSIGVDSIKQVAALQNTIA